MSETTERIKKALYSYGHMLKNAYIPNHKKKKIHMTMKGLERELAKLEKEEKIANMQARIAGTHAKIAKLKIQSKPPPSALMKWLTESPDYLGSTSKGGKGGKQRRSNNSNDGFGLDFKW